MNLCVLILLLQNNYKMNNNNFLKYRSCYMLRENF